MSDTKTRQFPRHSRLRQSTAFREIHTNAWAAQIGFGTGRGFSSFVIADRLADGTSDGTVREMQRKWDLPTIGRETQNCFLNVPLTIRQRANISQRAAQHGLSPEEYCRRLLVRASMPFDLYDAIVTDPEAFE